MILCHLENEELLQYGVHQQHCRHPKGKHEDSPLMDYHNLYSVKTVQHTEMKGKLRWRVYNICGFDA